MTCTFRNRYVMQYLHRALDFIYLGIEPENSRAFTTKVDKEFTQPLWKNFTTVRTMSQLCDRQ